MSSHSPRRIAGLVPAVVTTAGLAAALATLTGLTRATRGLPEALGAGSSQIGPTAARSPHFADGTFHNTEPSHVLAPGDAVSMIPALIRHRGAGRPSGPVPLPIADLPVLDAIAISHDHYDHLDLPTVRSLVSSQTAPFLVPLGIGSHLRGWGVPENRIVELDWDEQHVMGDLTLTCTESRHFSGRGLKRNPTLWCSWSIAGPRHRVYFGGDTGYTAAFAEIRQRYGPFDITVLPIGAYGDQWPDIHLNPEEAVAAHQDLGGGLFIPIHWATFDLALHSWAEPVERLLTAAGSAQVAVPRPGERVLGNEPLSPDGWWRRLS